MATINLSEEKKRIYCPKCKKPFYWIKGEMCCFCLAEIKKGTRESK